jgi:hypothetical protein
VVVKRYGKYSAKHRYHYYDRLKLDGLSEQKRLRFLEYKRKAIHPIGRLVLRMCTPFQAFSNSKRKQIFRHNYV